MASERNVKMCRPLRVYAADNRGFSCLFQFVLKRIVLSQSQMSFSLAIRTFRAR